MLELRGAKLKTVCTVLEFRGPKMTAVDTVLELRVPKMTIYCTVLEYRGPNMTTLPVPFGNVRGGGCCGDALATPTIPDPSNKSVSALISINSPDTDRCAMRCAL